ncbi:MAG: reactive intermediate/imine deaminase [Salinisphaeraceae bacterium]|jgi:reactive intermediate/imine deaminase|nr:reactive intermediate/imine deaminase [Salinisphaeraceae bacterium]
MSRDIVYTDAAPQAIGAYSQAVCCGNMLYVSGQIPLDPATQALVEGDIHAQVQRVFANLGAIVEAAGATFDDVVKLHIYLTDMSDFPVVNEVMQALFSEPFPARAAVGVAALPKGARVEADAIVHLG